MINSCFSFQYENVKTDTGKIYNRLDYRQLRVDNAHPGAEGISIFSLAVPFSIEFESVDTSNNDEAAVATCSNVK